MSEKREDLQKVFDRIINSEPGAKAVLTLPNLVTAKSHQAWFNREMINFTNRFKDQRGIVFISRVRNQDGSFDLTIEKAFSPISIKFVEPKSKEA